LGVFLFFSASAFLNLAHDSLVNPVGMYSYRTVEEEVEDVEDGGVDDDDDRDARNALA
jgi:hypothetical protein